MAGDADPPRKGQRPSVEDWLRQKLGSEELSDPGRPVPELDTEPTQPAPVAPAAPEVPAFVDAVPPSPPPPEPAPWEGDTDPTPITRDLPSRLPARSETTATHPFPLDDLDSPELSDPGPYLLSEPAPEPEIEDLEPPRLGGFDEVFPGLALPPPPARDEETSALLGETSLGEASLADEPTRSSTDLEAVGDDTREPGTQWLQHVHAPPPAEEKTEIRGFAPFPQSAGEADDTPTLIVPPPMPAPLAPPPPRRETPPPAPPRPVEPAPTVAIDDPRMLTVAWWTGSAFGAAMFFLVTLLAGLVVAWQYLEF